MDKGVVGRARHLVEALQAGDALAPAPLVTDAGRAHAYLQWVQQLQRLPQETHARAAGTAASGPPDGSRSRGGVCDGEAVENRGQQNGGSGGKGEVAVAVGFLLEVADQLQRLEMSTEDQ